MSAVHSNEQSGDEHFARLNKDMTAERRPQFYLKTKIYRVCSVLMGGCFSYLFGHFRDSLRYI